MSWNVHTIRRETKTYVALKKNKRECSKMISIYILGTEYRRCKADLEAIFRELKIKVPTFDVKEVVPTNIS